MTSTESTTERFIVVGAGIAGLFAAMMLARPGREVVVLERDAPAEWPADPAGADAAFDRWRRPGVGQLRHSHAFLARLVNILRERHPVLLDRLKAAGCREVGLEELLPSTLKDRYAPAPGDEAMTILMSRRTTFELVARTYVQGLPGVTVRASAFVGGLVAETAPGGPPTVTGVRLEGGETLFADLVIDAAGRTSQAVDWLAELGAAPPDEPAPAGILYYTRHWRLNPGQGEPPKNGVAGAGDLGYLKFGLFNADNGCFSVTLAVPEVECELRQAIVRPDVFDAICDRLPGVAPWTVADRATPVSKVFAMGDLTSHWRRLVVDGQPLALGIVLVGDGGVRSNPLYGRGTSFAAIEAVELARALDATADPAQRLVLYDRFVEQALRPFFDDMVEQDRSAIRRAAAVRAGTPPSLRGRVLESFIRDGAGVAVRSDLAAFRAALRAFHMMDPPRAWLREPRHLGVLLSTWAKGKKRNAHLYPAPMGPGRAEMLAALGIERDSAAELAA
jgi:2-polyprenyl-6-methoxyphenol hydroxylase-like FAD-dependent oxidoreductase